MISAESAISRFRRDLTLGSVVKALLLGGAVACLLLGQYIDRGVALALIGGVWLFLAFTSAKGSRLVADSPHLIAAGQFEQAEMQIDRALRTFSLFRAVKLMSLHHLAMLRHAQRRWQESAMLCRTLLGQRLGSMQGISKPSRLILADALLEMGDLRGAYEAINGLYTHRLTLGEALSLMLVQLDYHSRLGAWQAMMDAVATKVQMAELMPSESAARAQALLALAAKNLGRTEWADWLRQRVELLADRDTLVRERPMLKDLW